MIGKISKFWKYFIRNKIFWPIVTLGILFLFNLFFTPNFFAMQIKEGHLFGNLIDILKGAAPIMLLAIGLTLVIATKGIDISVGSVVAMSAGVVAVMIGGDLSGVPYNPLFICIIGALAVGTLAGMWNGMLVSFVGMQPIIATLILFTSGRGIAMLSTNGQIITIYHAPFFFIGSGYLFGLPFSIYIVAFVFISTVLVTRRTAIGLFIESVGINPTATRFSGINAKRIVFWCYTFTGFCAGIAGIIVCSVVKSADGNNAGNLMELDAILAVVLGGTSLSGGKFYLMGSMMGALIIQTLTTTIYAFNVAPEISQVVKAFVVFGVSLLQSEIFRSKIARIFGKKEPAI
jgi:ribose/xylose/arabinose/galactoside ABC-type transport system permease subunit